jgi:uncharacterized membrane-anchored protein
MEKIETASKHAGLQLLSKVPEVTIYFWIIKVLCTTVGETAADYLNVNLNLGLTFTSVIMGISLIIALIFQFRSKKYVPGIYWLTVFLISIFGTLVTDNLTDSLGVPLELSTIVFSILLALTFALWYMKEKTLSIHSIYTRKREAFYWLAILFTFALGTAAGDLMAESLGLGYLLTGLIICAVIIAVIIAVWFKLNPVLGFWIAYIMTRPLGASIGDYLSQSPSNGGLGLGPTITTVLFVLAIILTVIFLSVTKKDQLTKRTAFEHEKTGAKSPSVFWQVAGVILVLVVLAGAGYYFRHAQLENTRQVSGSPTAPLGDLSEFKKISEDTLNLVRAGKLADAKTRIADFETAWDDAEAQIRPMSPENWSKLDTAIDKVLRQLRAFNQDAKSCETSLVSLIDLLNSLDSHEPA